MAVLLDPSGKLHHHRLFKKVDTKHSLIEMMAFDKESFLQICKVYPRSAERMQKISVRKMRRLNKSRVSQDHLHYGNRRQYVSDRKHPIYLETRAAQDLKYEVKKYRTD